MSATAATGTVEQKAAQLGIDEPEVTSGWLARVVTWRMGRSLARARAAARDDASVPERARRAIGWACAKTAVTGLLSGTATTSAALVTAETEGAAAVVAVPAALAAVGGEMVVRTMVHVDLACELGGIFDLGLQPEDDDVLRLLALAFGGRHDEHADLGCSVLKDVTSEESSALLERAGQLVLGESVLRNLLPVVGIASSALANVVITYRLGGTLQRAFRHLSAVNAAFGAARDCSPGVLPVLVEGIWFVFTADGRLTTEETACLARCLDALPEAERNAVTRRFTDDECDWLERAAQIPKEARTSFLEVLQVCAALDAPTELPAERILRRLAERMGMPYDPETLKARSEVFAGHFAPRRSSVRQPST